ncbi:tripartite motif-containing protein 45 [Bufo gargarizans]|uniref:tripartite motif-containing protein 45 n=1 Tax=Bufo gargarizans TaxID=30331 RepID=UPI001CF1A796|nr:tripartite motif-containing protein 45 [Bufo gargarizans]
MAQIGPVGDTAAIMCRSRCPQCQESFSDPRVLPCLHTLCMSCLQSLEPFSMQERGQKPATQQSVLCPVCDSEVSLPPGGIPDLIPDLLAQTEVLLERLRRGGDEMPCDLCGDGKGERRCLDCRVTMCEFCCLAHRRQKRTAGHSLLPLQDLPPGSSLSPAPVCTLHPLEELRLFCESCALPSCRDCALVKHLGHEIRLVVDVAGRHRAQLHGALVKSGPQLEALENALRTVQEVGEDLKSSANLLRKEVEAFTEGYIRAIQDHKVRLLQDIEEEVRRKDQALSLQRARIHQQLADVRTATTFTRDLLDHGPDLHIVRAKALVIGRLNELNQGDKSQMEQTEADRIIFNATEKAALCQGYQMYGLVQRGGVDPERCQVRGQGLQTVQQGNLSSFTLICNTNSGDQLEHKGAPPRVIILHKESGRSVPVSIQDNQDGTYHISYTPTEAGQVSISVCMKGRHIRGSPFTVNVRGTSRQHSGVYHCCTFCSSGGQKDARCGCGGSMPGGFQGCGHGHKGHPGQSHWSCCGSTSETSECTGVKDSAPRNLLRTVAL